MKSLAVAAVLALTISTVKAPQVLAQNQEPIGKPAAVKPRIIINKSDCNIAALVISCKGQNGEPVEFRIEDMNSPGHVTVIRAQTIQLDESTGEIKPEGNVTVTLEILK